MRTTATSARHRRARRARWTVAAVSMVLAATLSAAAPARAVAGAQIQVPAGVATIQGAIDAASSGDTVVVAPGTYHEHIDFKGKAIEVRSSAGPATTTIDGDWTDHVVAFASGEGRSSVLRGFTIANGLVLRYLAGGGVAITNSSPTIVGNVITGGDALGHQGAGIGALGGSPLIEGNHVIGNHTSPYGAGGGLFAAGGAEIVGNVIEGNTAGGAGGAFLFGAVRFTGNVVRNNHALAYHGGGLSIGSSTDYPGHPVVQQNLISGNVADLRGGGITWKATGPDAPIIVNNTIVGNQALYGSAIEAESDGADLTGNVIAGPAGSSTVECFGNAVQLTVFGHNDVYNGAVSTYTGCADPTGANGNISADPHFVSAAGPTPDYHLQAGSPAIDAGDGAAPALPTDVEGLARVTDGDGDGTAVIDMGAYEAPAQTPKLARTPYTVWTQPTGTALDGLGGWLYSFVDPAAADGQRAPSSFFAQYFGFASGGAVGQIGLVTRPDGKFAVFSVVESNGTTHDFSVPFEWSANRFYFPLVYTMGPGLWAGWIYDDAAATWTQIGVHPVPAAWGMLAPASITAAPWVGPTAGRCSAYPRTDVAFYAPYGFVAGVGSVATATRTDSTPGDCAVEASVAGPWAHYRTGADALGPA